MVANGADKLDYNADKASKPADKVACLSKLGIFLSSFHYKKIFSIVMFSSSSVHVAYLYLGY